MSAKLTAGDLLSLLESRHSKDIFLAEVKDGPTWAATHRRMDAWAMRRSYSRFKTWGYEVKVNRQDFLRDDKWPHYLPNCNEFYFVAPPGLIDPKELPDEAGLIVCSKNAKRLLTKKKAPHRQGGLREDLALYLLFSRCEFMDERRHDSREAYWRNWLAEKKEKRHLGIDVSRAIREHVDMVEKKNRELQRRFDDYDTLVQVLAGLGITDPHSLESWKVQQKCHEAIHDLRTDLADWQFARVLHEAQRGLERIAAWVETVNGEEAMSGR